tara:strand:- start:30 stop:452 length:423 start_codon:yes stop_codon:yes gene_type:complete
MKVCGKCKQSLDLSNFGVDRRYNKPRSYCKPCCSLNEKEYRKKYPEKIRASNIKQAYKVSLYRAYELMAVKNCESCNVKLTKAKHNVRTKTDQVIDHCHDTGEVRGVLCSGCNLGLGHFTDSVTKLENAIKYIKNNLNPK